MSKSKFRITKKCEWCGNEFQAQKATTKYCCKRCAEHAYKERMRIERVKLTQSSIARQDHERAMAPVADKEYLTPKEAAALLGVERTTIYRYLWNGQLTGLKLKGKTFIRRSDIEKKFEEAPAYTRHTRSSSPSVEEWYTTKEIMEKFGVSNSWVFEAGKKEGIPKVMKFGRTYWSKSHCDRVFAKKEANPEITEWYTAAEMKEKFGMTDSAIWNFVSKKAIPKKKEGGVTYYSKRHVDLAKGLDVPDVTAGWYTYAEAMEKYGLTHDQVCHYLKTYKIKKVKIGKFTKFSREEFDNLLAPPIL